MKSMISKAIVIVLFLCTPVLLAQKNKDIKTQPNPFSEPRFSFFKETILLYNEYLDRDNSSFNTTNLRILKPMGSRAWNLRLDIPLISTATNSSNTTGLGDISISTSFIPFLTERNGISTRLKITTPSAHNPSFGLGKWIVAPALYYGTLIGDHKNFLYITDIEYQQSVAGSELRDEIQTLVYDNILTYRFGKNWISGNLTLRYNFTIKGLQNSSFVEYGRKITPDALFYLHPSIAFGRERFYNYGMEVGMIILY